MAIVLKTTKKGPIQAQIELHRTALSLFSQRDQNTIIATLMRVVGIFWVSVFLPKRFTNYARTFLGYFATKKWEKKKVRLADGGHIPAPQPTPMVYEGTMRQMALSRARVEGTATAKRSVATIRIPYGHAIRQNLVAVFKTIPAHETARLAEVAGQELPKLVTGGVATYREKGPQLQLAGATSVRPLPTATPRKVG